MKANPYLIFDGQCDAAFKFYEQALGGKIIAKMTYGEAPLPTECAPAQREKIIHARLQFGDQILMGSDAHAQFQQPQGFFVTLSVDAPAEADRLFHALAEGGKVTMPIDKTFFAERFAMLSDRFGTPWMIICEKPA